MRLQYIPPSASSCKNAITRYLFLQVALMIGTVIVMSDKLDLRYVPDFIFETRGNSLAYQFLEGVQSCDENIILMVTGHSS